MNTQNDLCCLPTAANTKGPKRHLTVGSMKILDQFVCPQLHNPKLSSTAWDQREGKLR